MDDVEELDGEAARHACCHVSGARRSTMPRSGLPLLAPPPLLTGRSIPVRGKRRGEERSREREVEGEGREEL